MHALKHPIRFISIFALVLSAVFLGNAGTAAAANPLLCFEGPPGDCTINPGGTSATLNTAGGGYAGVYYATSSLSGKLLSAITELSFNYTGSAPGAGAPRISLPTDINNDGATDYLSIAAFYCNNGAGLVDPIHDDTCTIWSNLNGTTPLASNWADLLAAYPNLRVGSSVTFVIADEPGIWTISNVHLGAEATFASTKDECKDGGWEDLTRADDTAFKNQGDCIQYVNTGK